MTIVECEVSTRFAFWKLASGAVVSAPVGMLRAAAILVAAILELPFAPVGLPRFRVTLKTNVTHLLAEFRAAWHPFQTFRLNCHRPRLNNVYVFVGPTNL